MNAYRLSRTCAFQILLLSIALLALYAVVADSAFAELYVAGQVGYAMPSDLSNIKGTGSSSGISSSDLALKNNIAYGLKIGGRLGLQP